MKDNTSIYNIQSINNCFKDLKAFYDKYCDKESNIKGTFKSTKKAHQKVFNELKEMLKKHDNNISQYGNIGIMFFVEYDLKEYEKDIFLLNRSKKKLDDDLWRVLIYTKNELDSIKQLIINEEVKTV